MKSKFFLPIIIFLTFILQIKAVDETVDLKYGPGNIRLHKSKTYVAVKPRSSTHTVNSILGTEVDRFSFAEELGGFKVLKFKDNIGLNEELDKLRTSSMLHSGTHVYGSVIKIVAGGVLRKPRF